MILRVLVWRRTSCIMQHFFSKEFFRSSVVHWALISALIVNATLWGVLAYFVRPVDFPIVLHYNAYFGVDMIGDWWQIYALPTIGMCIMVVNTILGIVFYDQKERVISHLLLLATCIAQILLAIAAVGIILINY